MADQPGQLLLLAQRKTWSIGVLDQIGAVNVGLLVRQRSSDLVQRRSPAELAQLGQLGLRSDAAHQIGGDLADPPGLAQIDLETALQVRNGLVAQILLPGQQAVARAQAFFQIEDHTLAQRPACRQQCFDAKVHDQGVQDRQSAGQDALAAAFQTGQRQPVETAGLQAGRDGPTQALRGDRAVGDAVGQQDVGDRSGGSRGPQRLLPLGGCEGAEAGAEGRGCADLCGPERCSGVAAIREEALG